MKNELRYNQIAAFIKYQISEGVLPPGAKLPSVRTMSRAQKASINTVLQAYLELEKSGLIHSKPQSGFYVNHSFTSKLSLPAGSKPAQEIHAPKVDHIFTTVYNNNDKAQMVLSSGQVAATLLPVARLTRELVRATKTLPYGGLRYERKENAKLKRQVALRARNWGAHFAADDVLLTTGCMHAMTLCMQSLLPKGATIGVESPVHFGIINLVRNLGYQMVELPTDPVLGLDLDILQQTLRRKKIHMLILMGNFSNPFSTCMPEERKQELVRIMTQYEVPVIENDIYGDIYFEPSMPRFCKAYDESGIVMWCGSAAKTLAGGYKTGWLEAGRFKQRILQAEPYLPTSCCPLTQEAMASFMEHKAYNQYQRQLNQTLAQNALLFQKAIHQHFPENVKVTQPRGGIHLWLEFSGAFNCLDFYNEAIARKIGIRPGRIYTSQDQFNNAISLSYGLEYDASVAKALKTLGTLAKKNP
jgi:DNA-binding transcriptional MocR family regulator